MVRTGVMTAQSGHDAMFFGRNFMPLINRSTIPIFWRIFGPSDPTHAFGIDPAYEGTIPPGGQAGIGYSASQFQLELRDRPLPSLIPPSRVLVPAGPPNTVGQLYRSSDTLEYLGGSELRLTTQERFEVPGFLPSTHGFKFRNSFPANTAHASVRVGTTEMAIGDAANGLCGGMVFAVRDYFHAGLPIPLHKAGPVSGALYEYLVSRLYDSFELPLGWTEYLRLMSPGCSPGERARTAYFTAMNSIETDIRNGAPSPIGLVQVNTDDPFRVGNNHQVLVYGYQKNGRNIRLRIYDPNHPGRDDITLAFDTGMTPPLFSYSVTPGGDGRIFTFFCHKYQLRQPPAAGQVPPWVEFPFRNPLAAGASNIIVANGWLGLLKIDNVLGNRFNGTLYGQTMEGDWNPTSRAIRFTRFISSSYKQLYTGFLEFDAVTRSLTGLSSGRFQEIRNDVPEQTFYDWSAASRLLVDGNGWLGELRLNSMDSTGAVAGEIYGDQLTGRWDQGAQRLHLTRRTPDPNYTQEWTARRTTGLTFAGDFQEVLRTVRQARQYRWMAFDQR